MEGEKDYFPQVRPSSGFPLTIPLEQIHFHSDFVVAAAEVLRQHYFAHAQWDWLYV
jgi:hypothetical protein